VSGKHVFRWAFLGVTVVALGAELWASFDSSPDTEPWTDLLTTYVPAPVTYTAIGILILWLPLHFWLRYRRKAKADKEFTE
jgi:hypothetical protein